MPPKLFKKNNHKENKENNDPKISLPVEFKHVAHGSIDVKTGEIKGLQDGLINNNINCSQLHHEIKGIQAPKAIKRNEAFRDRKARKSLGVQPKLMKEPSKHGRGSIAAAAAATAGISSKESKKLKTAILSANKKKNTADITWPVAMEHVVHVRVDNQSPLGFSGLPKNWEEILKTAGLGAREATEHPDVLLDVLNCHQCNSHENLPPLHFTGYRRSEVPNAQQNQQVKDKDALNSKKSKSSILIQAQEEILQNRYSEGPAGFVEQSPYEIYSDFEQIGQGSFGTVYRAQTPTLTDVAVKQVKPRNDRELDSLSNEVKVMRSLHHENLLKCHLAYKCKEDYIWLVMDYMDCGSVTDMINYLQGKREQLSENIIAYLVKNLLQGISYLHSLNKIHRDIKSDNVLISTNAAVKIADFGLVANLTSKQSKRTSIAGTPFWMAPEVIRGQRYDFKADIWSVGAFTMECATGSPPFVNEPPLRAMYLIATQGCDPNNTLGVFSPELQDFVALCTKPDPQDRASAQELLQHPFLQKSCSRETVSNFFRTVLLARGRKPSVQTEDGTKTINSFTFSDDGSDGPLSW